MSTNVTIRTDLFSAGEASQLTGVNWRVLDAWAKSDFLTPSIRRARGTGSRRTYSFADLVALAVVQKLRAAGMELAALKPVVAYLQRRPGWEQLPTGALLILEQGRVWEELPGRERAEARGEVGSDSAAPVCHLVDLAASVRQLQEAVAQLEADEPPTSGSRSRGEDRVAQSRTAA